MKDIHVVDVGDPRHSVIQMIKRHIPRNILFLLRYTICVGSGNIENSANRVETMKN